MKTLHETVQLEEDYELLIVDDGSNDATPAILARMQPDYPKLTVVTHPQNQGLGSALHTGFRSAKGRIIVTMDADLTHPPELISPMVDACTVDMVVASRYVKGGGMADVPWWRVMLSVIANNIFRLLFATRLHDITAGFKAYRKEAIQQIEVAARGFEVQLEITVRLLKQGVSFNEIPYILKNREAGASKMRYLRLLPTYALTFFELFRYRWNLGRTRYDQ